MNSFVFSGETFITIT